MGPEAPDGERIRTLGIFMNSLRISRYDWGFRYHLLRGILQREMKMEECITSGTRQRYGDREQIRSQKQKRTGKYPNTWFLAGEIQNTLKI